MLKASIALGAKRRARTGVWPLSSAFEAIEPALQSVARKATDFGTALEMAFFLIIIARGTFSAWQIIELTLQRDVASSQ
jgi:hypothetical protein